MSEPKRSMRPDDLFQMRFLQGAALSPDGRAVVYALARYDAESDEDKSALWLVDVASGQTRQMTAGDHRDSSPAWSPDGRLIGFTSTRSGKPQIYVLPVDGGEARQVTRLEQGVREGPVWSPDGRSMAFTAGLAPDKMPDLTKPYRITRTIYRWDGAGLVDAVVQNIFVVEVDGDGAPRQLTDDAYLNSAPRWSPDGRRLLYNAAMAPERWDAFQPTLCTVTLEGEIERLLTDWGEIIAAEWLPDGEHLAFIGTPAGLPIGTKKDLWLVALGGGQPVNRTTALMVGVGGGIQPDMPAFGVVRSPALKVLDEHAYVGVQAGGEVRICRVALAGDEDIAELVAGERANLLLDVHPDRLLYAVSTLNDPLELYTCDLDGDGEKQLTQSNTALLQGIQASTVRHLLWTSVDGAQVEGWYLEPPDARPPYPTILYIHGGPHSAYGHMYSFDFQMLNGAGYGVLVVNHRASMGYGDAFSTAIRGDWGHLDYHDLMTGVDHAIAQGLADADRLGVCGISGGGNLSCWIVGQTDRFKAAIPENPVTNWLSFYGTSDLGVWFCVQELGGHPHEIPEVYARCSPITYAHRCTTPTLLVQGDQDLRCPAEQSEQFYAVLRANGCPVEMLRLPNSPHAGSIDGPPALRRAQNEAMLAWFDRYVLNKSET